MASDLPPVFDGIEAVCFDAFGMLVERVRAAGLPVALCSNLASPGGPRRIAGQRGR